jgi:outer membrane receptor protein involved in Fe transport
VYDTDYNAKAIQLNEVGVKAKRTQPPPKIYRQADYVVQGKDLQNAVGGNFLVALQGRVPGIEIKEVRDGDGFIKLVIYVRGNTSAGFRSVGQKQPQPLILVDGVPFEDINQVAALSPSMVERVEVVTRAEPQLGLRGYAGVISIFTKLSGGVSDDLTVDDTPGMKTYSITGYTLPATTKQTSLIWLPNINLDFLGKATGKLPLLSPGTYRFVAEGFTVQGQPIRTSTFVKVE